MFYNLIATAAPVSAKGVGYSMLGLLPFIIVVGGFMAWDMFNRKKATKKQKEMYDGLKIGDKIVTIGGLVGEIASIQDDIVDIKVDKGIRLQFKKKAIAQVIK